MKSTEKNQLILESSLQTFFFDHLDCANKKCTNPLPNEIIYYSSLVMDKFGLSHEYFDNIDGRVREKVLGIKLLESGHLPSKKQQRELKDIGDTALFLCGYFSESVNQKIVDLSYYRDVGQIAYHRLNSYIPSFYEVDSFYKNLSKQFDFLATLMKIVQQRTHHDFQDDVLLIVNNKLKAS